MKRFLTSRIAWRYLRSKKSHSAVSAIAIVSVVGVAVATAAVVCVLSVFNGFREILTDKFNIMAPDLVVTPTHGKVFAATDSILDIVRKTEGVGVAMPTVTDKALAIYDGKELPVTLRGVVVEDFRNITGIDSILIEGSKMPSDYYEEVPEFEYYEDYEEYMANTPRPEALMSIGAAVRLGHNGSDADFVLFAPRREGRYNPANPAASFVADSVSVSGIYEAKQNEYDEAMIVVPINLARHLFQYDQEATGVEIKALPGSSLPEVKEKISSVLGPDFEVKTRMELQEVNFRMVNIEKWVSFLLLFFILIIATFNIVSTMTMLVLEKRRSMAILSAIGMNKRGIVSIFRSESMIVSIVGGLSGVALGVVLCLLQEHFGLIKLNGDPSTLLMAAYPVRLIWSDVLIAFLPALILGLGTALIAGRFARSRIISNPTTARA